MIVDPFCVYLTSYQPYRGEKDIVKTIVFYDDIVYALWF